MATLRGIIIGGALAFLFALLLAPFFGVAWKRFRRMGFAFALIAAGYLHSMATKPDAPNVTWDDYLANDGTCYASNGVTRVGVAFKWRKTNAALPSTQPLYISYRADSTSAWTLGATTTVGALAYTFTLATPNNYQYYVWHEWVPPTPVHTNGVWIGAVLEKPRGHSGVDKIIVIKGKLEENGRKLNP